MKNHQNHFVDTLSMSWLILLTSVSRGFLSEVGHPPNRKPCDTDLSHTGRQGKQKGQASSPRSTQGRATSFVTWRPALYEFSIANKKDAPIYYNIIWVWLFCFTSFPSLPPAPCYKACLHQVGQCYIEHQLDIVHTRFCSLSCWLTLKLEVTHLRVCSARQPPTPRPQSKQTKTSTRAACLNPATPPFMHAQSRAFIFPHRGLRGCLQAFEKQGGNFNASRRKRGNRTHISSSTQHTSLAD